MSVSVPQITDPCTREQDAALAAILEVLRERTGIDFSRYRTPTIRRRVLNRMISVSMTDCGLYLELLRADSEEPQHLVSRVTIKVSRFYRNTITFDTLRRQVIPELKRRSAGGLLRVWSAGCGRGEEAYTLAMLLDEADAPAVIEATDIDQAALTSAMEGRYTDDALEELPAELRERYLRPEGAHHVVRSVLRERVRFATHDLTAQAAFTGERPPYDLICCRNVLIYFQRAEQQRVLRAVAASLRGDGFLCLGEAEWPLSTVACALQPLGHQSRVFRAAHAPMSRTVR